MKRTKDRATRILALILMGMMCLGLAACGTVTEADSSIEAEAIEVEEEQVGATSLEVYFVLDEVTDEMTAYKINGGYYYISTEQAAAIAEELGEDFSFADADGNIITVTSDGSYSSDTGKALLKVVGVGDVFTNVEDMSLTVVVTEIAEEETTASTGSSRGSSSSSSSSGNSSSSGGSSSASSDSNDSDSFDTWLAAMIEAGLIEDGTGDTTASTTTAETTEEETECEHNWKKLLDREDKTEVVLCGCGEYFIVDDYGSYNEAVKAWSAHANDCWGSYTTAYIYGTYYECRNCGATKECSDTELNLVFYSGTRDSSSYVLAQDQS